MKSKFILLILLFTINNFLYSQCDNITCWNKVHLQGGVFECESETTVFEDNFEEELPGNSIDYTKWQTHFFDENYPAKRTHLMCEEQFFFDDNVTVSNGECVITGLYEPNTIYEFVDNITGEITTYERNFTSGVIMSRYDMDGFSYGRYEASLKIPGHGWHPTFWLHHFEEVDIFENFEDDGKYISNVYSGSDNCSNISTEYSAPLLDGNWHKFAVEWTPFKISFYHNDVLQYPEIYRLYDDDGVPLNIDCNNARIPQGIYYMNPNFLEIRRRTLRPIVGLSVLQKHGGDCDCNANLDCDTPSSCATFNNGHPIDDDCNIIGEIPAYLRIDYVKVFETEYKTCGSILVYGDNCELTGDKRNPKSCFSSCINEVSKLYVENYSSHGWLNEVQITSVSSSSNVEILGFSNFEIEYKVLSAGNGAVTINYIDDCGIPSSFTISIAVNGNIFDQLYTDELEECANYFIGELNILGCNSSSIDFTKLLINAIVVDKWGNETSVPVELNDEEIKIRWADHFFTRKLIISADHSSNCYGEVHSEIEIDIPQCNECCPDGFEYNGHSCYAGYHVAGVEYFIENDKMYTTLNCDLYQNNNCCPPETVNQVNKCLYKLIEPGFSGFTIGNSFYTNLNCDKNCCPDGFVYDGANCSSRFYFVKGEGFIEDGKFYTEKNCDKYQPGNNCCPPGTVEEGEICFYREVPLGYDPFIHNNTFYVHPDCGICCPEGSFFDGANCSFRLHFLPGEGFIHNNSFLVHANCERYSQENDCCPEGSVYNGAHCYFGIHFEDGHGFLLNNTSVYSQTVDCFGHYGDVPKAKIKEKSNSSSFENTSKTGFGYEEIEIFPNPFGNDFTIDCSRLKEEIVRINIVSLDGKYKRVIEQQDINDLIRISDIYTSGVYLVSIITSNYVKTYKIVSIR